MGFIARTNGDLAVIPYIYIYQFRKLLKVAIQFIVPINFRMNILLLKMRNKRLKMIAQNLATILLIPPKISTGNTGNK
jgi:hypothetical protein